VDHVSFNQDIEDHISMLIEITDIHEGKSGKGHKKGCNKHNHGPRSTTTTTAAPTATTAGSASTLVV